MTRIKICGLSREADVDAAVAAGADAIGLVLWPGSARALSVERAAALARRLPPFVMPVCLFVNADPTLLAEAAAAIPHALFQFHGDETPGQCDAAGRRKGLRLVTRATQRARSGRFVWWVESCKRDRWGASRPALGR